MRTPLRRAVFDEQIVSRFHLLSDPDTGVLCTPPMLMAFDVLELRVMIYRKHVPHESPKNFQLDLFTPDDGHFEYYAVATVISQNLSPT